MAIAIASVEAVNNAAAAATTTAFIDIDDMGVAMSMDEGEDDVAARGDDAVGNGNVGNGARGDNAVGNGNVGVCGEGGERVTKKRKGKVLLSDLELLHYFETNLGSGLACSCQDNFLRILEDVVIITAVASYLVWFERRLKIEQDNIVLQWIIYGHPPGGRGRHSFTTSQN